MGPVGGPNQAAPGIQVRSIKVEFPRFDGDNVPGWLFKANQFFGYNQTQNEHKVLMASFQMEGDANNVQMPLNKTHRSNLYRTRLERNFLEQPCLNAFGMEHSGTLLFEPT